MTWFGNIATLPRRWRAALAGVLVLLLLLLFFPFQTTTVPPWRLRVVDDAGALVRDINVTEHWQHYLVETEGHEEKRRTDDSGRVDFPERAVRMSIASRVLGTVRRFFRLGAPVRPGPFASVVVWGKREYETVVAVYEPGASLQTEFVLHRQR